MNLQCTLTKNLHTHFFGKRDFLLAGGFGEMLGNDVTKLQRAVQPCSDILDVARKCSDVLVIHTREGHRLDMSDVHEHKQRKGAVIGSEGPMGRILLRGEPGHDIIPELYPLPGEPIIDKPGKVRVLYFLYPEMILHSSMAHFVLSSLVFIQNYSNG
jgi:nicotinamidase-related amidase